MYLPRNVTTVLNNFFKQICTNILEICCSKQKYCYFMTTKRTSLMCESEIHQAQCSTAKTDFPRYQGVVLLFFINN